MRVFDTSSESIAAAADVLRVGGIVAFPTETVYGLGADALNTAAVEMVFLAKGRPADNPLIVHIADREMLGCVARDLPRVWKKLADRFWPGALTLVLPRVRTLPEIISAGLDTVAVRMPDHPVALELIRAVGAPLAAPSANISGRPSATCAEHVLTDFGNSTGTGTLDGVIDGGPCSGGIESTVLSLAEDPAVILRPGAVSGAELAEILGYAPEIVEGANASPGTRHTHYQPRARVVVIRGAPPVEPDAAYMALNIEIPADAFGFRATSVEEMARRMYAFFRQADTAGVATIYVEEPPADGLGAALRDRLKKASGV